MSLLKFMATVKAVPIFPDVFIKEQERPHAGVRVRAIFYVCARDFLCVYARVYIIYMCVCVFVCVGVCLSIPNNS